MTTTSTTMSKPERQQDNDEIQISEQGSLPLSGSLGVWRVNAPSSEQYRKIRN
jgi:hypothetical protein